MKRIKLKSPVVIRGHPEAKIGVPLDVQDGDAMVLVGMGAAEFVGPEEKADGLTTGRGIIETREPETVTRDPEVQTETAGKSRRKTS